jgi:hypothetical protein
MKVMSEKPSHPQLLSIVHLWSETEHFHQTPCRGSVEYTSTGQKLYFTSLGDLTGFIALKAVVRSQPIVTRREPKPTKPNPSSSCDH